MCQHHFSVSVQSEDTPTGVSPDSDEFVLVLMNQCEQKLQLLHRELQGQDLAAIMKEMEEEEVGEASQLLLVTAPKEKGVRGVSLMRCVMNII